MFTLRTGSALPLNLEGRGELNGPSCPEAVTTDSSASTEPCGADPSGCGAKVKTPNQELSTGTRHRPLLPSCFSPNHVVNG